jgi:GMP synthase-like glutamine amidotransferase
MAQPTIFVVCAHKWRSSEGHPGEMGQIPHVLSKAGFYYEPVFRTKKPRQPVIYHPFDTGGNNSFNSERHCGLIVLGDEKADADSWVYETEREWVNNALKSKTPVLGICHGAQLLACLENKEYLKKNRVNRKDKLVDPEADSLSPLVPFVTTQNARGDRLFQRASESKQTRVFQWHCNYLVFPDDPNNNILALVESSNKNIPHSDGFCLRNQKSAYGVQFHPEVTRSTSDEAWFKRVKDETPEALDEIEKFGRDLIGSWVELVRNQ